MVIWEVGKTAMLQFRIWKRKNSYVTSRFPDFLENRWYIDRSMSNGIFCRNIILLWPWGHFDSLGDRWGRMWVSISGFRRFSWWVHFEVKNLPPKFLNLQKIIKSIPGTTKTRNFTNMTTDQIQLILWKRFWCKFVIAEKYRVLSEILVIFEKIWCSFIKGF